MWYILVAQRKRKYSYVELLSRNFPKFPRLATLLLSFVVMAYKMLIWRLKSERKAVGKKAVGKKAVGKKAVGKKAAEGKAVVPPKNIAKKATFDINLIDHQIRDVHSQRSSDLSLVHWAMFESA
ncbi:hypothetical protein BDZ45DRAFT_414159 [Acephala macrosclerotiorum]|nr:hypothetical protein BDZ45DRAFT_414159 [Acephala macrosclerotiorum]